MTSLIPWLVVGLITVVFLYAVFSVLIGKPSGLFIAFLFHTVLGILSLPSIGLYVLGLAILELIIGIVLIMKYRHTNAN